MKAFIIDVALCNGCYCCQIACKDEHVANDWTPYARPQPDTGQFWLKLNEYIRGTVPKVKMHYLPVLCMHCEEAPCLAACPMEGVIYRRKDGLVIIDPQKCTGCAHLLDKGWKEPRCVDACPTQALKFGEESDLKDLIAKSELMKPELGARPRVYYLNIPKKFVAGTIYDPVEKEVIIGATCTLSSNGKKFTATTDGFGDFWFKDIEVGMYSLKIEAKGFAPKTIKINTEKDVNLGDIPLSK
jgi:tetrathionate reductase subunit B